MIVYTFFNKFSQNLYCLILWNLRIVFFFVKRDGISCHVGHDKTKQNSGLLSPDKSSDTFPARRRNVKRSTAVHQPKDVTEMEATRSAAQKKPIRWRHGSTSRLPKGAAPRAQVRAGGSHQPFAVLRRVVLRTMAVPQPHASAFSREICHFYIWQLALEVDLVPNVIL